MNYLSVCSGIEAATVAWHSLGWMPVAFSEIEPFPSAVLAHHYPGVPNLGDMTKYKEWNFDGTADLLVGGTPCQSFSVAGLRRGLDDPRGNLMLVYLGILGTYRPRWMVWENVPGVLSSNGGRDFGAFLGGLGELGYGFAYRVLDAQYLGVPQRRRRVFVVGYLGDWRPAAAVLFERHSLSGNPPPRREAGEGVTSILEAGARTGKSTTDPRAGIGISDPGDPMFTLQAGKQHGIAQTVPALTASGRGVARVGESRGQDPVIPVMVPSTGDVSHCLNAGGMGRQDYETETMIAYTLRAEHDASEDGTGRGTPLVPTSVCLGSNPIHARNLAMPLTRRNGDPGVVQYGMAVRRLTPRECERLQGFPDDYTLIPYRGKPAADDPRYRALGNSMAVPVMRWIGERIQVVEETRLCF